MKIECKLVPLVLQRCTVIIASMKILEKHSFSVYFIIILWNYCINTVHSKCYIHVNIYSPTAIEGSYCTVLIKHTYNTVSIESSKIKSINTPHMYTQADVEQCSLSMVEYAVYCLLCGFYSTSCVTVLSIYTVKLGIMINNLDYHLEVKLGPWNSNDLFDSRWNYI